MARQLLNGAGSQNDVTVYDDKWWAINMNYSVVAELLRLPAKERLHLVEMLWERLAVDPAAVPLGEAHCMAIDEAPAEHQRNPDDVLTLDQVLLEARRAR